MDREAWCAAIHGVTESRTRLSNWTELNSLDGFPSLHRRRRWHPTPGLLPGKSHGRRSLVGCSPWGRCESDTTEQLHFHVSLSCIWGGNGNPLHCSCLENPRDGGAWWAAVYGVAQSRTRLKRLSSIKTTRKYYCPPIRRATVKNSINTNAAEAVETRKSSSSDAGNINADSHYRGQRGGSLNKDPWTCLMSCLTWKVEIIPPA